MPQDQEKITAVRLRQPDGQYGPQIPVGAKAENIQYDNLYSVKEVLGNVKTNVAPLQEQIDNIQTTAIGDAVDAWMDENATPVTGLVLDSSLTETNQAAQAKAAGKLITVNNQTNASSTKLHFNTTNEVVNVLTTDDIDSSLSMIGTVADAKAVGDQIASIKNEVDSFLTILYNPPNISLDENEKIFLEKGYIAVSTGSAVYLPNGSGTYYKTQSGTRAQNFLLIGDKPIIITCKNVDFAEWTCWSYSGITNSTATHSNTNQMYQPCTSPIYVPSNGTDTRFAFSFRTLGANDSVRLAFTEEQLTIIKNNIKFWNFTDDALTVHNAAADARVTGDAIRGFESSLMFPITDKTFDVIGGEYIARDTGIIEISSSNTYARTNLIDNLSARKAIKCINSEYKYTVAFYSEEGDINTGAGYIESPEYTQTMIFIPDEAKKIALSFKRVDLKQITEDDISAIQASIQTYSNIKKKTIDSIRGLLTTESYADNIKGQKYSIFHRTYYDKNDGTQKASNYYTCTRYKLTKFGGHTIYACIGDEYELSVRLWDSEDVFDSSKNTIYNQEAIVYIPEGWKIAFNFRKTDGSAVYQADSLDMIASFHIYTSAKEILIDGIITHDGNILRMDSIPDAIPQGSNPVTGDYGDVHMGYNEFINSTWETLLPNEYQEGDSYNESTTKILNVHVSRESSWTSTPYGNNQDTYTIYRYIFTPVNGYSKTVFLSSGCHGNEAEAYWSLYRLIRMIYFEGYKYPTLRNLRNVRFIIVPSWNPWGFQHYRRYNAFESNSYQAWKWLFTEGHQLTINNITYDISDVGEASVIWDTINDYGENLNLWIDFHTDPYAGRTTNAGSIDDPRGYTNPYGMYGFIRKNTKVSDKFRMIMEDFYNILKNEQNFTETWHFMEINPTATSFSTWMASMSFPTALVEVSTYMANFPYAQGSAGLMKLAQEYYGNCLAELICTNGWNE